MVRTTELNQLRYINHLSNTQCINKIYYLHVVPRETTALQLDIFNKRKRHVNETNVAKEGLNLK